MHRAGFKWPGVGTWLEVEGPLSPCRVIKHVYGGIGTGLEVPADARPCPNGLHVMEAQDICNWYGDTGFTLYEVGIGGEHFTDQNKEVCLRARLRRRIGNLDERLLRLVACDAAKAVLQDFEKEWPEDKRPRQAIETARRFARGKATLRELKAAKSSAGAATKDATKVSRNAKTDADKASASAAIMAAQAAWDATMNPSRVYNGKLLLEALEAAARHPKEK